MFQDPIFRAPPTKSVKSMVILSCGAGTIGVSVHCDGRKLEEYGVSPVSGTRQQCSVASEENKVRIYGPFRRSLCGGVD